MNTVSSKRRPLNFKLMPRIKVSTKCQWPNYSMYQYKKPDLLKPIPFKNTYNYTVPAFNLKNYINYE